MAENNYTELVQFSSRPLWYTVRGVVMIALGFLIAAFCITSPEVYILSANFSWIPAIAMVIILLGAFRCIDALATVTAQGFLVNMQGGVLDLVVGFLVLFSIDGEPENMSLLIVAYMVTQGIYRNILLSVAKTPNPLSNRMTGFISILLGALIWLGWPSTEPWFLALCLSIDVSFRGWALIVLASSIKNSNI